MALVKGAKEVSRVAHFEIPEKGFEPAQILFEGTGIPEAQTGAEVAFDRVAARLSGKETQNLT